jgi:hypothetical protein
LDNFGIFKRCQRPCDRMGGETLDRSNGAADRFVADPCDEAEPALGDGAGFVEEDLAAARETFEGCAAFHEDVGAGEAADGDGDRERRRQAQHAGAGDDQQRNRVIDRQVEAGGAAPIREGGGGGEGNGGDKPRADAIGELDDLRFLAHAALDQAHELPDARLLAGAIDADAQDRADVVRAGVDFAASRDFDRQRFAGEHGEVDGGAAGGDDAIGGDEFTAADFDEIAGLDGLDRRVGDAVAVDQVTGGGGEREEELDGGIGAALLAVLHPASDQEEEDQNGEGVEVNLAAVQEDVDGSGDAADQERQGDGDVEVERARAQRCVSTAEEDRAGPGEGDHAQHCADPAEEHAIGLIHPSCCAGVEAQSKEHRVAHDRTGDAEVNQALAFSSAEERSA